MVGSLAIGLSTVIFGKLIAPFLANWIGSWSSLIDFTQTPVNYQSSWFGSLPYYLLSYLRYSIVGPIGCVAGATLSGMLAIVRYQLIREGGRFQPSYAWTAGVGSAVTGGVLGVFSILIVSWLGWQGLLIADSIFKLTSGFT